MVKERLFKEVMLVTDDGYILPNAYPVTNYNMQITEIGEYTANLAISGVVVDNVRYFTCGHIYIL